MYLPGAGLNCAKKKLHEVTKLHVGTKLHENKIARVYKNCTKILLHEDHFARGHKIAQGEKIARILFCTEAQFCTSYNFAWKVSFARRVNFAQKNTNVK